MPWTASPWRRRVPKELTRWASPRVAPRFTIPRKFQPLLDPIGSWRYRVFYGGRGSAKSHSFARALLIHGMQRRLRIFCLREYQASMKQSVHLILSDLIRKHGLEGRYYRIAKTEIIGHQGTEFFFGGLRQDIDQIKSTEGIDIAWVEEAHSVRKDAWEILIPTIRAAGSEIWVSFNPDELTDNTYQRFCIEGKTPARSLIRKVTWRDNPYLSDVLREEREDLLRNDPEAEAHVWEGEPWTRSDAQVLKGKWEVKDFTPDSSFGEPLYGLDFGFARDPLVAVKLWRKDRMLWVEYADGGLELDHKSTCDVLGGIPGGHEGLWLADNSRPETINELRQSSFNVIGADKWDGSVKDGIQHLRSYEKIIIHPRCALAISEARGWRYKTDPRTGAVISKLRDGFDNSWDASRYALSRVIQRRDVGGGMVWYPGVDGGE